MDGKSFAKLARDTDLLDTKLSSTDVDLVFARIKEMTERRITYEQVCLCLRTQRSHTDCVTLTFTATTLQFIEGLHMFAEKKFVDVDQVPSPSRL
eukprot:2276839-Rhodomonas_salina.2